jgi:hypothetical protein
VITAKHLLLKNVNISLGNLFNREANTILSIKNVGVKYIVNINAITFVGEIIIIPRLYFMGRAVTK